MTETAIPIDATIDRSIFETHLQVSLYMSRPMNFDPNQCCMLAILKICRLSEPKECCTWVSLTSYLPVGNARKSTAISLIDTNKEHPSEGYSDQEVLKRYSEVAHAVAPDHYAQAAEEALSKLSPEERAAFVKMLQDQAAARGVTLPRKVAPEPKELGQVLTDLHGKPGQLRDMLGGGAAQPQEQASGSSPIIDILKSPMAKAVLAGIAAMVVKRVMNPSQRA